VAGCPRAITYIRLPKGFCYLAAILDAYSRKVLGWELSEEIDARLVEAALKRALQERKPPPGGSIIRTRECSTPAVNT